MNFLNTVKSKIVVPSANINNFNGLGVVFNTESTYFYFRDAEFRDYVNECDFVFIDGSALALTMRMFGIFAPRFHGPDVIEALMQRGSLRSAVVLGGSSSNLGLVHNNIISRWIALPFADSANALVDSLKSDLDEINQYPVVCISLGMPKQEKFARLLAHELDLTDKLVIPCGAAIDFLTGHKTRSAIFWRLLGLEWLPRLLREPRMFPRIGRSFYGLFLFIRAECVQRLSW